MDNQEAKFKNGKENRKQNNWGKKESQKGRKMEKHGLVHLHFVCIYVAFVPLLFWFFWPGRQQKKQHKKQTQAKRKSKISRTKCKWKIPVFALVLPF